MINEDKLRAQLEAVDDATLQEMVRKIGAALGLGAFQTKMMAANPGAVRKKLGAAEPGKLEELLAALDSTTLAALLASLENHKTPTERSR